MHFFPVVSSCCVSLEELGNMSSLSLWKWFAHNVNFFLKAVTLPDCSIILCPLPCIDTFNELRCSNTLARKATCASQISLLNKSAYRELFSKRKAVFSVLSSQNLDKTFQLESQWTSEWYSSCTCSEPWSLHKYFKTPGVLGTLFYVVRQFDNFF